MSYQTGKEAMYPLKINHVVDMVGRMKKSNLDVSSQAVTLKTYLEALAEQSKEIRSEFDKRFEVCYMSQEDSLRLYDRKRKRGEGFK